MAESFYYAKLLDGGFEQAIERVTAALGVEGFGVLSTIEVDAKLQEKLGVSIPRYTILGACNPALAHEALKVSDKVGLLMPCNVVVQQKDDGVEVSLIDPEAALAPAGQAVVDAVGCEARNRIERVFAAL